ncbi:MAG: hypothetical protein VKJ06_04175 [Vampirovibrionales bacterium]|nr:hypothetical protein [Vampirovibrionales bacterium]
MSSLYLFSAPQYTPMAYSTVAFPMQYATNPLTASSLPRPLQPAPFMFISLAAPVAPVDHETVPPPLYLEAAARADALGSGDIAPLMPLMPLPQAPQSNPYEAQFSATQYQSSALESLGVQDQVIEQISGITPEFAAANTQVMGGFATIANHDLMGGSLGGVSSMLTGVANALAQIL